MNKPDMAFADFRPAARELALELARQKIHDYLVAAPSAPDMLVARGDSGLHIGQLAPLTAEAIDHNPSLIRQVFDRIRHSPEAERLNHRHVAVMLTILYRRQTVDEPASLPYGPEIYLAPEMPTITPAASRGKRFLAEVLDNEIFTVGTPVTEYASLETAAEDDSTPL